MCVNTSACVLVTAVCVSSSSTHSAKLHTGVVSRADPEASCLLNNKKKTKNEWSERWPNIITIWHLM